MSCDNWLYHFSCCNLQLGYFNTGDGSSTSTYTCNLRDLMNDVASKIPAQWKSVGIQLNLSRDILDGIQAQNAGKPNAFLDSFEQVFTTWERHGPRPYTWSTIVEVLRSPAVGKEGLANEILIKHPTTQATQHSLSFPHSQINNSTVEKQCTCL